MNVLEMIRLKNDNCEFLIMKYQVTQQLWNQIIVNNPSGFKGSLRPVEQVNWFDCLMFANKLSEKNGLESVYKIPQDVEELCKRQTRCSHEVLIPYAGKVKVNKKSNGYRLPTVTEWEYAAKGEEEHQFAGSNNFDDVGWNQHNSEGQTHFVGQKKSNGFGLYDMSGNVYEWCFDAKDVYIGDQSSRCTRGGSYRSHISICEMSFPSAHCPSYRYTDVGVRLCRSIF